MDPHGVQVGDGMLAIIDGPALLGAQTVFKPQVCDSFDLVVNVGNDC